MLLSTRGGLMHGALGAIACDVRANGHTILLARGSIQTRRRVLEEPFLSRGPPHRGAGTLHLGESYGPPPRRTKFAGSRRSDNRYVVNLLYVGNDTLMRIGIVCGDIHGQYVSELQRHLRVETLLANV